MGNATHQFGSGTIVNVAADVHFLFFSINMDLQ